MRERPQANAVARRVPVEASPSPGRGGGADGYQRHQRQSPAPLPSYHARQQHQEPPRPHSFIGFSRTDSYGGGLDFYSSKYNRGYSRNSSYSNFTGRSGALSRGTLRPNKSSSDLLSADSVDLCPSPSLYRDLFNGSPSLINPSPFSGLGGRTASREISPLRSQSVLSNRSYLNSNNTREISPLRSQSVLSNRSNFNSKNNREISPLRSQSVLSNRSYLNSKNNRDIASNLKSEEIREQSTTPAKRNIYNTRLLNNKSRADSREALGKKSSEDSVVTDTQDKQRRRSSNGVTFALPEDDNPSSDEQASVYGQFSISAAAYRRMSAPELPPITTNNSSKGGNNKTPRGDKRKTSLNSVNSSGSKVSHNQLPASINSKAASNKKGNGSSTEGGSHGMTKRGKKKKMPIPRNHSDSSLKNLVASSQGYESGSSGGGGGGGGAAPALRNVKYLAAGHRALSWCATDNSGSQSKLETLFEGQNHISSDSNGNISNINNNNNNNNSNTLFPNNNSNAGGGGSRTYSPLGNPIKKTSSSNSISNLINNNIRDTDMPPIVGPRSVSVNGIRNRDDVSRLKALNKKLMSENGDTEEIETVDEFVNRGKMRRSNSENKLSGKANQHGSGNNISASKPHQSRQTHRSMSRNLSVDRIDRLTSNSKPQRKNATSSRTGNGANSKMRRVNSVSNIPNSRANSQQREALNDVSNQGDVFDDDEENIEASHRLVEWLNVVNNIDEYDTDPKDQVVDYPDEPPQTDTALHLVYEGE